MVEISTSILAVKENETQVFYNLEVAKTDYFHIDVMDRHICTRKYSCKNERIFTE